MAAIGASYPARTAPCALGGRRKLGTDIAMTPALRRKPISALTLIALASLALAAPTQAQQSRACTQLEAQLAAFDRGGAGDPARADQIRRYEDAANRQQFELDRTLAQSRQMGCEGRGFFLFSGPQPEQCGPLTRRIQQQRANLDQVQGELARLSAGNSGAEREGQRRAILAALSQNDCGPQYRQAAQPRGGLFEALFGPGSVFSPAPDTGGQSGTFRTVCVRTCDGYFYPISFATTPNRFMEDEKACQRSCPAAEVALYSYRNPGGDIKEATSVSGQPYTALPNAFRYRQAFDSSCSCRRPGESWADAMKHLEDHTVERGDIVVNEQRARQMSQPRVDAQGRPIRPDPRAPQRSTAPASRSAAPQAEIAPDPNRKVRTVGPTFYPVR